VADPKITTLIDRQDNCEVVRDQIAAILLVESLGQQELARVANKTRRDWEFRVFTERANPWVLFPSPEDDETSDSDSDDELPIVNVSLDGVTYDKGVSDIVQRQTAIGTFNIDCYAGAVSKAGTSGHLPGDEAAAFEAQRVARLVRSILMAAHYTYLDMRGVVGQRWPASLQMFQPSSDGRVANRNPLQHVMAVRLTLEVRFNEFSPQVVGQPLELISAEVKRSPTGQLLLRADYPFEESP
jgi:hypothetical protein